MEMIHAETRGNSGFPAGSAEVCDRTKRSLSAENQLASAGWGAKKPQR